MKKLFYSASLTLLLVTSPLICTTGPCDDFNVDMAHAGKKLGTLILYIVTSDRPHAKALRRGDVVATPVNQEGMRPSSRVSVCTKFSELMKSMSQPCILQALSDMSQGFFRTFGEEHSELKKD